MTRSPGGWRGNTANRDKLYGRRWREASRAHRRDNPLCVMCQREGRVTPAEVTDHRIPHKGDETLFWDRTNWQSLCKQHHDSDKQREEKGGKALRPVGLDGYPLWE